MQNNENLIITVPNKQDIDEILDWLKKEFDSSGMGFYSNRDIIYESFQRDKTIVLKRREKSVGLVTWSEGDIHVDIGIFVINSCCRSKGYGGFFYESISEHFRNEGFMAIKLFCCPPSSEQFWRKMGLHKFPDIGKTEHELTYYGFLMDTASNTYIENADKIELWDVEPSRAREKDPKWSWYIEKQNEELVYPIIQPCNCNWNLRWSRNDQVLKENKVKHFTDEYNELYYYPFLCLDVLEELNVEFQVK